MTSLVSCSVGVLCCDVTERKRRETALSQIYKDADRLEMLDVLFEKREKLRAIVAKMRRQRVGKDDLERQKTLQRVRTCTCTPVRLRTSTPCACC